MWLLLLHFPRCCLNTERGKCINTSAGLSSLGKQQHLARSSRSWGNHTSGSMQHPAPHQGLLASKYSMLEGCRITGQGAFSNHLFPRFACLKERSEHSQLRACISKASPAPAGTRLFCTSCYKCKFGGGYFVPLFLLCFHLP